MTYKEKLQQEHPDRVGEKYAGGCWGCPYYYGYESCLRAVHVCLDMKGDCEACWNREIPEKRTAEAATPDGSENN